MQGECAMLNPSLMLAETASEITDVVSWIRDNKRGVIDVEKERNETAAKLSIADFGTIHESQKDKFEEMMAVNFLRKNTALRIENTKQTIEFHDKQTLRGETPRDLPSSFLFIPDFETKLKILDSLWNIYAEEFKSA